MPQIVSCPDCGRKLRVPDDLLGKKVKCPGCGQKFLAEIAEEPDDDPGPRAAVTARIDDEPPPRFADDDAPKSRRRRDEEEDEDYPASRRRDRDDDDRGGPTATKADVRRGWERVRFGVNLILIGTWIEIAAVGVFLAGILMVALFGFASLASIAGGFSPGSPPTQTQANQAAGQAAGTGCAVIVGFILVYGVTGLMVLAYHVLRITGIGFFMGVASTRKTQHLKWLGIATFCLALAGVFLPTVFWGLQFAMIQARMGGCIVFSGDGLTGMAWLAEFICYFLFLRGVAVAMKKDGLAQNLVVYMIAVPVYGALAVISGVVFFIAAGAALFGAASSSVGSNNAGAAAGNMAGTGAAIAVAGITCWGLLALIALALFIWSIVLLYQVRGALDRWLDRN